MLANNTLCPEDAIRAIAMLKTAMDGGGNQEKFKNETGPKIAHILKDHNVDAVVLTAG